MNITLEIMIESENSEELGKKPKKKLDKIENKIFKKLEEAIGKPDYIESVFGTGKPPRKASIKAHRLSDII